MRIGTAEFMKFFLEVTFRFSVTIDGYFLPNLPEMFLKRRASYGSLLVDGILLSTSEWFMQGQPGIL